MSQKLRLEL